MRLYAAIRYGMNRFDVVYNTIRDVWIGLPVYRYVVFLKRVDASYPIRAATNCKGAVRCFDIQSSGGMMPARKPYLLLL